MDPKIIKSASIKQENFGAILVQNLVPPQESKNMSVAIIELSGVNKKAKNKVSDTFYYILEGNGVFTIEDKEYEVSKGDLVIIPKNIFYFDSGRMKMLSFLSPRFDAANVEYSE